MRRSLSIGLVYPARAPVEKLPALAAGLERAGLDELWVVEDCFLSGGMAMTATALALTDSMTVGVGLMPAVARNPAIAAMDIATLARLHPGRVSVAIGHGVAGWMRQIGAYREPRLVVLEEVVSALRSLLSGETVSSEGRFVRLDGVVLENPPATAPEVLIGTTGPKGLALAARVSDGVLLNEGCGPAFVSWAVEQLAAAGDTPSGGVRCVVYAWMRIDDQVERARLAIRPAVDRWLQGGRYPEPYRFAGARRAERLDERSAMRVIEEVAVAGDARACAEAIRRLADAGADSVVLAPVGPDVEDQAQRLASEVLPLLPIGSGG